MRGAVFETVFQIIERATVAETVFLMALSVWATGLFKTSGEKCPLELNLSEEILPTAVRRNTT